MLQRKEMTMLLINVISTKMLLTFPKTFVINSGNSAWIQALYNSLIIILIFFLTTALYRGKKNILELSQMTGGKGLKIAVGILLLAALFINVSSVTRIFPETVKIVLLQDFNIESIIIVFILAAAAGAYIGINSIAKINYIFMPFVGIVFALFLLLLIPYYRIENILPVFGNGYKDIFVGGFNTVSMFSDIILLNILLPKCENLSEANKSGRKAIYISAAVSVIILAAYCLIYPYPSSEDFMIPVYQLARIVHLSSFFSRFEALFQSVWSIIMLLYASIYIYAICYVIQTMFDLKYYRPLIFPVSVINGIIAVMPSSLVDMVKTQRIENIIIYPAAFLLPIIFGIVSRKFYGKSKTVREESGIEED